jgi:DNA-directed RNA polymerase specialized sigma subunit
MLGREPTTNELADHLKWSEKEVMRVGADQSQKDLIETAFEGDPTAILPSRTAEVMRLVKYELTPEETLVYEYTLGVGGKPQLAPGQIAKTLGMSPSKVTNIRTKIYDKAKRYL